jgi:signal transduction histidine kinase
MIFNFSKYKENSLVRFYLTIIIVFVLMWVINFFFKVTTTPPWFLPLFILIQVVQLLLSLRGFNSRVLTNLNFFELLALSQLALLTTENYYHNMVYWIALIPLLIVATAISIKDAIFWHVTTFLFVVLNGIYAYKLSPHYTFEIYPLRFIVGGSLFLALSTFVSFMYYRIQNKQKDVLASKNQEIEIANSALNNLNVELEDTVNQRTAKLLEQNKKLSHYAFVNSHEIRGPLASILGLINIMDKDQFKEENHLIIEKLKVASDQLDTKINYSKRTELLMK